MALVCLTPAEGLALDSHDSDSFPGQIVYQIKPSATDLSIERFDDPHYIVFASSPGASAQLVLFMPGTGGKPANAAGLLSVVAEQGYRVIGLEYDNDPAVVQVCAHNRFSSCSSDFRRKRIFGEGASVIDNPRAESIVNRLVKLLEYLEMQHPGNGWSNYLAGAAPKWDRIVVSGMSQGAGMAAYIAKREQVARVVLFSSPWDFYGHEVLAPWLSSPSVTPPERWFAEYHKRENTAALIARAYVALQIPRENIRVFGLPLPSVIQGAPTNPFHLSTIRVPAYAPDWRFLFGHSP
jgi:predicted esterase